MFEKGKKSFEVMIGLQVVGWYPSFQEAFKVFYEKVKEEVGKGTSYQWLETTNFITTKLLDFNCVLGFYEVSELAHKVGILSADGKLQDIKPEDIDEKVINTAFMSSTVGHRAT